MAAIAGRTRVFKAGDARMSRGGRRLIIMRGFGPSGMAGDATQHRSVGRIEMAGGAGDPTMCSRRDREFQIVVRDTSGSRTIRMAVVTGSTLVGETRDSAMIGGGLGLNVAGSVETGELCKRVETSMAIVACGVGVSGTDRDRKERVRGCR